MTWTPPALTASVVGVRVLFLREVAVVTMQLRHFSDLRDLRSPAIS